MNPTASPLRLPLCTLLLATTALAGDWPQWRGPARDGHAPGDQITLSTLPKQPTALWTIPIGNGQASPIVAAGRAFYLDEQQGQETAHALDLATGKEIWQTPFDQSEQFANNYGTGPPLHSARRWRPPLRAILPWRIPLPLRRRQQNHLAHQL